MWNKIGLTLVAGLVLFILMPSVSVLAAPELKVGISVGLDEKAKYGEGAPLTLTIENSGTDFVGDLVVDIPQSYSMGNAEAIPLALTTGETKTVSIMIPRMDDSANLHSGMPNGKSIYFYEGGWKKGKEIAHKGTQTITSTLFYDDAKFIVLFTDNVDRLQTLRSASIQNSQKIQFIDAAKLGEAKLPDEETGWGAADFIVIDEYPIADLPKKKQDALLGWVRAGGILVLGASTNIEAEAGIFKEHLPLRLKENSTFHSDILNSFIGDQGFTGTIPSFSSHLNEGASRLLENNDNVLIASKDVETGLIIQSSFSFGDDPLVQMDGMTALWNRILEEGNQVIQTALLTKQQMGNPNPMDALVYTIGNSNELFPSFKVSTPLIFGIIIFYIIVIIPILYFVLKRKDKREYAWWIIPVIAVLTSIGIFAYGAKDRMGRVQVQHSAVLNVNDDGSVKGFFAESLLSNKSGQFSFKAPTGTTLTASKNNLYINSSTTPFHEIAISEKDGTGSTLHMRNIGFWSVATVYGEMTANDVGKYEAKLQVDEKKLTGTVMNDFPFGLKDVSIWSGSTLIPLGDLGSGEMITVDETLKYSTLLPKSSLHTYRTINPTVADMDDLYERRKDSLLAFSGEQINVSREPVLIGFADTKISQVEVDHLQPSLSSLTMIVQPIQSEIIIGDSFIIEPDMLKSTLTSENGLSVPHPVGYVPDQYYFNESTYIQTWQLPDKLMTGKINWNGLTVNKLKNQMYAASIFNVKTGTFEVTDASEMEITSNVNDYISPKGQIRIRMDFHNVQDGNEAKAPELRLTGEVGK